MQDWRTRKSISVHLRIDPETADNLKLLQQQPSWRGTSEFMRRAVNEAAIRLTRANLQALEASKRADQELDVQPSRDPRLTPGERWHGTTKPVLFDPTSRGFLKTRRIPKLIRTDIDDPDNT